MDKYKPPIFIAWDGEGINESEQMADYMSVYPDDAYEFEDVYGDVIKVVKRLGIRNSPDYPLKDYPYLRPYISTKGFGYDEVVGAVNSECGMNFGSFDELLDILLKYENFKSDLESRKNMKVPLTPQKYVFIASSMGDMIEDWNNGLRGVDFVHQIFDLFLKRQRRNVVQVVFGASYDFTMILRSLPFQKLMELKTSPHNTIEWDGYTITYIRGKFLSVKKNGHIARVFDVMGFFQSSFGKVLKQFFHDLDDKEKAELQEIIEQKANRENFDVSMRDQIVHYNFLELKWLVRVMDKLASELSASGLHLRSWTGAGAMAEAFLKQHESTKYYKIKNRLRVPSEVIGIARYAYYGGRAEIFQAGMIDQPVYNYDINSAYPYYITQLPSLLGTYWVHRIEPKIKYEDIRDFSLYKVKWSYPDCIVGGFPYRSKYFNTITFPDAGIGWYWGIEVKANLEYIQFHKNYKLEILEAYEMHEERPYRPFTWVGDEYRKRQELKEIEKATGIHDIRSDIKKMGINSIYGKFAQRVGHKVDKFAPPYHNILYAGFITAGCRAQILRNITNHESAVVSIATDGVFATEPLERCESALSTKLGEYEKHVSDRMFILQAGFYFYEDKGTWYSKTRGVLRSAIQPEMIQNVMLQFRLGKRSFIFPINKFMTVSQISSNNYDNIGSWVRGTSERDGKVINMMADVKREYEQISPDRYISYACMNFYPDELGDPPKFRWGANDEGTEYEYDNEREQEFISLEYYDEDID